MPETTDSAAILVSVWDKLDRFSQETFGSDEERGPIYPLRHLEREAREAQVASVNADVSPESVHEEIVDCYLIILDAARRAGMDYEMLLQGAAVKLAINMTREWGEPDQDGVIEHVDDDR